MGIVWDPLLSTTRITKILTESILVNRGFYTIFGGMLSMVISLECVEQKKTSLEFLFRKKTMLSSNANFCVFLSLAMRVIWNMSSRANV
jgi:hypothetical protein